MVRAIRLPLGKRRLEEGADYSALGTIRRRLGGCNRLAPQEICLQGWEGMKLMGGKRRRAFVISPIGPEGSATRDHANDVFEFIIAPALAEVGLEPARADHLAEPGRITEQMFDAILGDSLCIAVLSGQNPNVYYELAIAHAAARPSF